jgi:hypothetical protein
MYNFNADNITTLPDGRRIGRSDELGHLGVYYIQALAIQKTQMIG